jgi:low affinity Fe/Cu permease
MKFLNEKFLKIADAVSFGMGTPTNILFWILAVAVWFFLGITQQKLFTEGSFLPKWFTSNAWNFPLNTITTLAELYIGFLVAAATNRAERELRKIIENMKHTLDTVERINRRQNDILKLLVDYQKKEIRTEHKVLKDVESLKK